MRAGCRCALLLLAALAARNAVAEPPRLDATGGDPDARARLLDNKLRLLDMLLNRGETARRIEQGGDPHLRELLSGARSAYAEARGHCQDRRLAECERALDRGIEAVAIASRLSGDPQRESRLARERHPALQARVTGFRAALARIIEAGGDPAARAELGQIDALLREADGQVARDDYVGANAALTQAAERLEFALSRARDRQTLVHELRFATPADEYAYELERNRGHEAMVRMLLGERPAGDADRNAVLAALEDNRRRRAEAEQLAARGDATAAIRALEQATEQLVRALRRLGAPLM